MSSLCDRQQRSHQCLAFVAGVAVLPAGQNFPGTATEPSSSPGKRPVIFATAGEKGVIKVWSSASGGCVYEQQGRGSTAAGNYTWLALIPGAQGLVAATADCNLQFLHPTVTLLIAPVLVYMSLLAHRQQAQS